MKPDRFEVLIAILVYPEQRYGMLSVSRENHADNDLDTRMHELLEN